MSYTSTLTWSGGRYGEFKVMVDDDTVIDGAGEAFLGVMPSRAKIVAAVRVRLDGRRPAFVRTF